MTSSNLDLRDFQLQTENKSAKFYNGLIGCYIRMAAGFQV